MTALPAGLAHLLICDMLHILPGGAHRQIRDTKTQCHSAITACSAGPPAPSHATMLAYESRTRPGGGCFHVMHQACTLRQRLPCLPHIVPGPTSRFTVDCAAHCQLWAACGFSQPLAARSTACRSVNRMPLLPTTCHFSQPHAAQPTACRFSQPHAAQSTACRSVNRMPLQ
jgi:hypothetical protein